MSSLLAIAKTVVVHLENMKRILVILTVLLFALHSGVCQSYGSIEGIVYDSVENSGIAYANIVLLKANLETHSDLHGKFNFDNVAVGEDVLECSIVGYGSPKRLNLRIIEDTTVFIRINLTECEYDFLGQGKCPVCNRLDQTIPIFYGEPTAKTLRKAKKGRVFLGGCLITRCNPNWYCKRDEVKF